MTRQHWSWYRSAMEGATIGAAWACYDWRAALVTFLFLWTSMVQAEWRARQ